MPQSRSWAGLDVHARSVHAVTVDSESGEMRDQRLPGHDERGRRVLRVAAPADARRV